MIQMINRRKNNLKLNERAANKKENAANLFLMTKYANYIFVY